MGRWAAKPMAKFAMAGEERVPLEPCVNIRLVDGIGVGVGAFLLPLAIGGLGVLHVRDEASVGAERTQGIGLGEKGRSKWCFCDIFGTVICISDCVAE